jgi:hypothetical protein
MSHKGIALLNDISKGIDDDIASIETTMNDSDEPHSYEDIQLLMSIQDMLRILKAHVAVAITEMRK